VSISLDRQAKSAGKTKISQLDCASGRVDQQVLWFQISVENAMLVQVDECLQDLVQEALCFVWVEWVIATLSHEFLQIKFKVLEDQV